MGDKLSNILGISRQVESQNQRQSKEKLPITGISLITTEKAPERVSEAMKNL